MNKNDKVKIIKGPLLGLQGKIVKVNSEKKRCKVSLDLNDSPILFDLGFEVLEIVNEKIEKVLISAQECVKIVNRRIIENIKDSEEIYFLKPREFEIAISEILENMGFEIKLTKQTRDNGRDILALYKSPIGEYLTIVECKKYALRNKIGIEPIQRLLWVADNYDGASKAMFVTTSTFTAGARTLENKYIYKLSLNDINDIKIWIDKYGKKTIYKENTIWTPNIIS